MTSLHRDVEGRLLLEDVVMLRSLLRNQRTYSVVLVYDVETERSDDGLMSATVSTGRWCEIMGYPDELPEEFKIQREPFLLRLRQIARNSTSENFQHAHSLMDLFDCLVGWHQDAHPPETLRLVLGNHDFIKVECGTSIVIFPDTTELPAKKFHAQLLKPYSRELDMHGLSAEAVVSLVHDTFSSKTMDQAGSGATTGRILSGAWTVEVTTEQVVAL